MGLLKDITQAVEKPFRTGASSSQRNALATARKESEAAAAQTRELLSPYTDAGERGLYAYEQILGLKPITDIGGYGAGPEGRRLRDTMMGLLGQGVAANPYAEEGEGGGIAGGSAGIMETLRGLPGYQFNVQEQERAIKRQASAGGYRGSGRLFRELMASASGLAEQNYQSYLGNITSAYQNELGGLAGLMQIGQASVVGEAAAIDSAAQARASEALGRAQMAQQKKGRLAGLIGTLGGTALGGAFTAGKPLLGGPGQSPYDIFGEV